LDITFISFYFEPSLNKTLMTQTETTSKFTTTYNKGFQMTFNNGWSISVQWGVGNYCSVGRWGANPTEHLATPVHSSPDCEIMIWKEKEGAVGQTYNFGNDEVKGYCDADEVAEWIWKVKNFPA
jgi:hypothetical protein